MNLQKKIAFYKKQEASAKMLKEVAKQSMETAARLESEAKSALAELGVQQERPLRGGKLSQSQTINLLSSLTQ